MLFFTGLDEEGGIWEISPNIVEYILYGPSKADRIWLWVSYKKIPTYPIFYLLKEDYILRIL